MRGSRIARGPVVVITGAANGIGAATARLLASQGVNLVLADVDRVRLDRLLAELDAPTAIAVSADVAERSSVEALLESSLERFGGIDAVVNCAGVIHPGALDGCSVQAIRRQLDVNLFGTINVTQIFLACYRRQSYGHFLLIASLGGVVPLPHEAVYCATKFAVRGFGLALALELRDTAIRVSVILPDSTVTAQLAGEARYAGSPLSFLSEPLQPYEVATAIVRTMRRPRLEVAVPGRRGLPTKLLGISPTVLGWLYPVARRQGVRRRELMRAELDRSGESAPRWGKAIP